MNKGQVHRVFYSIATPMAVETYPEVYSKRLFCFFHYNGPPRSEGPYNERKNNMSGTKQRIRQKLRCYIKKGTYSKYSQGIAYSNEHQNAKLIAHMKKNWQVDRHFVYNSEWILSFDLILIYLIFGMGVPFRTYKQETL